MADKLFYTVIVTSLLIAIIIVYFVISILRYHRRYIRLQKERIHAEITMQEMERKRIANDLHDSLGPLLSTAKLYIHSITVSGEEDKQLLDRAGAYIDETITGLREISYNLLPGSLSRNGLTDALKEYINRLNTARVINIELVIDEPISVAKENEVHLFRIIQEIIHNTVKHAKAANLQLRFTGEEGNQLLIITDDGVGFDPAGIKRSGGLGLKSIESRCEMLNASMQLSSAKGKGCKYVIKFSKMLDSEQNTLTLT